MSPKLKDKKSLVACNNTPALCW